MEVKRPILVIGYPNDRVRGKIRELHQKFNLPRSAFINVGLDVQKIMGMRGASYVDVGIGNLDYDRQYEVVSQYIAIYELKNLEL